MQTRPSSQIMIVRCISVFNEVVVLKRPDAIVKAFPLLSEYPPMFNPRISALSLAILIFCFAPLNSVEAQSPAGRWRGDWTSGSTGHHGPMRVNIRPQSNGTYSARFSGRFFIVIPFTYRVDMVPAFPGSNHLVADKKLGPVMGSYRMQTVFGSQSMIGQFQAAGDNGAVQMTRVSR